VVAGLLKGESLPDDFAALSPARFARSKRAIDEVRA
jgi:hypothetical protein